MTIQKIDPDVMIPFDEEAILTGDPKKLAEEWRELVKTLQELLEKITEAANYALDLVPGDAIYSKVKNPDGTYPLGTWRLIQVGNNWERQVQLVLGKWEFAGHFSIPV